MAGLRECQSANSASVADGAGAAPATRRPNVQMPDEYLPPNKILFLQNLPESVTKDQLMGLFSQSVSQHSGVVCVLTSDPEQIPELVRSPSHSHQEGHRVRGIFGRRQRDCRKGRSAQLQARWRK